MNLNEVIKLFKWLELSLIVIVKIFCMETKEKNLVKYLVLGGALGLTYLTIQYLSKRKNSKVKPLSLEQTARVLQEIKFQMLTTCTNYAEAVNLKQKNTYAEQDLEIAFRTELAKICEAREDAVLSKYNLSREQYSASLGEHRRDKRIQQGQADIFDMMEKAVKGSHPDFTVPAEASRLLSDDQLLGIYLEMCELISVRLWQKLEDSKKNNPAFNSKNEAHYKKAVQELSIYDIKSDFLQQKGFRIQWGAPNEVFYKIMEVAKQKSPEFKTKANKIENAYNKTVETVTNQPEVCNPERIKFMMEESVNQKQQAPIREVNPPARNLVSAPSPVTKSLSKELKPKKEEVDMEELMMQELLSRSAENVSPPQQEPLSKPEPVASEIQPDSKGIVDDKIERDNVEKSEVNQVESTIVREVEKVEQSKEEVKAVQDEQERNLRNQEPNRFEANSAEQAPQQPVHQENLIPQQGAVEERAQAIPQNADIQEKPQVQDKPKQTQPPIQQQSKEELKVEIEEAVQDVKASHQENSETKQEQRHANSE